VALLVLRGAVVTWAGQAGGGLVDLGEVKGEIWGDIGVRLIDAGVQYCDSDACAQGCVPGTGGGAAGDVGAEASGLADGPALRGGVVGVEWGWRRWRSGRQGWWGGDADGGGDYGAEDERVCGDDAVVDDKGDIGLGAEGCDGGSFVGAGCGIENGDAKGLVEQNEMGVGEAGVGLRIAGDCAVAVDDEVAVRDGCGDGAGRLLGRGGGWRDEEKGDRDTEMAQGVNKNTSESGAA
jgi:hypothetical protein